MRLTSASDWSSASCTGAQSVTCSCDATGIVYRGESASGQLGDTDAAGGDSACVGDVLLAASRAGDSQGALLLLGRGDTTAEDDEVAMAAGAVDRDWRCAGDRVLASRRCSERWDD